MRQILTHPRWGVDLPNQNTSLYRTPSLFPINVHESSMKNIIKTCTWPGAAWVLFLENHLFLHLETKFSKKLVPNLEPKHNFMLNFVGQKSLLKKKIKLFFTVFLKVINVFLLIHWHHWKSWGEPNFNCRMEQYLFLLFCFYSLMIMIIILWNFPKYVLQNVNRGPPKRVDNKCKILS